MNYRDSEKAAQTDEGLGNVHAGEIPNGGWFGRFLPRSQSRPIFIFAMACYTFALQTTLGRVTGLFGLWPVTVDPVRHVLRSVRPGIDYSRMIDFLFIAPVIESFIVIGIIEGLHRLNFKITVQLIASVIVICLLHSIQYSFWGFLVAPAFLIYAGTYVYWRRTSFWVGAQMIIAVHFFSNVPAFLIVIKERLHA